MDEVDPAPSAGDANLVDLFAILYFSIHASVFSLLSPFRPLGTEACFQVVYISTEFEVDIES